MIIWKFCDKQKATLGALIFMRVVPFETKIKGQSPWSKQSALELIKSMLNQNWLSLHLIYNLDKII